MKKKAIIIGAGPAGLTAAYELSTKTGIKPIVFEMSEDIGGIAKTINYKGNRIDIGGHRFFSKSDEVMNWWVNIFPTQSSKFVPEKADKIMLIRKRLSRIFFLRKFFDYPVALNLNTISNLGLWRIFKIGISYFKTKIVSIKDQKSLEDFFINRFGRELYKTFFKDYTEKVWGVSCSKIKPEWGAQRIKGLSVTKTIVHAIKNIFSKPTNISQKNVETSLIEQFLYPKYGPGQLWEEVSRLIREKGGEVYINSQIIGINYNGNKITEVKVKDLSTGKIETEKADYFFSTMPMKDLINSFEGSVPKNVSTIANGLVYRDFITAGILLKKLIIKNETKIKTINNIIPDNWIYIQEPDVRVGRLQIFNNWSPYMVKDKNTVWIGMEYFCNEGDSLWKKSDGEFSSFAISELAKIGIIDKQDVLDSIVVRMPKTYPAYFGSYDRLSVVRNFTDKFENLFLIGRNGMHRYNNQDHSMLTAMRAVQNIVENVGSKDNIWQVNSEEEYHEGN